jgi:NIMA (never in mitosis gene a)-related kinase 1/4/5
MVGGGGGAGGGGDALHVVGRTSSCPAVSPTQRNRLLIALAEKAARRDGHMELELLEVLGRGMGGVCRKARRMEDGLLVVVKQIDISFCAPEERQAAHAEAAMQKSLRHPNIVTFLDEFEEDETLNIVMEFAPFGTLKQQLAKLAISLPQGRVAWLFANIMEGLAFLHENRVLHRDIKSDNVFICEGGIPKLGDFGVSKRLNTAQPLASSVVGTPLYVSPGAPCSAW